MRVRRSAGAFVFCLLLLAGCGGGGTVTITITLLSVNPSTSNDLNGGDVVTIRGSGFDTVIITRVTFGGSPGFNRTPVDDTSFTVTTPPAPGGVPGVVTVEVDYTVDGEPRTKGLFGGFTYIDAALPPNPTVIFPTTFTPTGLEAFTIQGSNLGPPGGTQQVRFTGIGVVTANVSADAAVLTGNAPVTQAVPPVAPLDVFVEPAGGNPVKVPTQVNYNWGQPVPLGLPNQTAGNASQPVRLADGYAVLCTSGTDNIWGNGNDAVMLVTGPPNAIGFTPILVNGFLSSKNSIPAVLDADTFVVYSDGPDGTPATGDELILHISAARSVPPVVNPLPAPVATGFLNSAPLVAISPTRIATTATGPDGVRGNADDEIVAITFNGAVVSASASLPLSGPMFPGGGANAWSLPFSPDGENVYAMTIGTDGLTGTADDFLVRGKVSQMPAGGSFVTAPFLVGPPLLLGGGILAAPAGSGGAPGGVNDVLVVFSDTGTVINRSVFALNTRVHTTAPRPYALLGTGSIAITLAGPDTAFITGDEQVRVFTNPAAGTSTDLNLMGPAVLATFGSGELAVWGPGGDFAPGGGDDVASVIDTLATSSTPFAAAPSWTHGFAPLTDTSRVFVIDLGADGIPSTGDENLIVHHSLALSSTLLPLATGTNGRLRGVEPFVPVGANWGLVQSPGSNATFSDGNDQLIVAFH